MNKKKTIEIKRVKISEHFWSYRCPSCGLQVKTTIPPLKDQSSFHHLTCENCKTKILRNSEDKWEIEVPE